MKGEGEEVRHAFELVAPPFRFIVANSLFRCLMHARRIVISQTVGDP